MIWLASISIVLLTFVTLCACYFYWKKQVYTREYFAFTALSSAMLLSLFVLTAVLGIQQTPWATVLVMFKLWLELPITDPSPLNTDQLVLALIIWGGMLLLLWKMYATWDGSKSIRQYQQEQMGSMTNPFRESQWLWQHWLHHQRLEMYTDQQSNTQILLHNTSDSFRPPYLSFCSSSMLRKP